MIDTQEHLSHNYIVRVKQIHMIRGLVVTFPKNILLGLSEDTFVYEIANGYINIYCGGAKVDVIICPDYAARFMISADLSVKMYNRKINGQLVAVFTAEDELIEQGDVKIVNSIMGSDDSEVCELEEELEMSLRRYAISGDVTSIDESVMVGFELISDRYIKGTSDE